MKKNLFLLLAFCLMTLPVLQAAEEIAMKPLVMPSQSQTGSDPFSLTVTGSGKMIPKAGPVFTTGNHEGMELPYLISTPKPVRYPRWALRQGWQGNLDIALEIKADGSVGRTKVMKSSGYRLLDQAASESVQTWHFHPAMKDGKAVVTCIQVPVSFQLEIS